MAVAQDSWSDATFLTGGGKMGALMRAHDWRASPVGAPQGWAQPLKTLVGVMLGSNQPMFIAWGPERTLLYNDAYAEVLGNKHPAALGCDVLEVWHEIKADLLPIVEQAFAGEPVHMDDIRLVMERKGHPEETHFSFSYTPVRDETGSVAGMYCACTETTGRVLAERALIAERDRCKGVLDNMGDAFVLLDREFRIIDMNAEAMRLESRPKEMILGKTHWEVHPDAAPELGALYRQAMRERRAVKLEHRYVWPDGRDTWIDMRAYPASGGLAVFYRDVTDAKRTEAALERNEAFSRGVLAASQDCIKVLGLDGSLETMSEGGQRALLIEDIAPFVGVCWADTFEPEGRASAHAAVAEARSGGAARFEAGLKTQRGELRWWDTVVSPILDAAGRPEKLLALSRDITDRKIAEARVRESEARLAFLDRLGAETAPLAEADAVLRTTTRLLGEHLGLSVCAYADMDEDQDGFTIRGDWARPGARSIVGHYSLADFGKLAVKNLSAGLPLVVNDNLRELAPEEAATFQSIGIAATICMPLVKDGRLAALMAVHDQVPRIWSEAELSLLREVTARSWAHVERVAATAELRESEARFRLMADAVPQIVWITDRHGRMEFLNKQFRDYTGAAGEAWTHAEMAANFIHAEDGPKVVAAFEAALGTGEPFEIEHRIHSAAGEDRWFLARAEPYRDLRTGEITRWFGASVDIHDRKLAEERLRELNETLESQVAARSAERDRLWNLSQDLLARADYTGMMSAVSPAWTRVLGWSETELLSRGYASFMHPDDTASTLEAIGGMAETGQPTRFENRIATREDGWKPIEWTVAPEPDGVHFIAVGRDLSLAKAREAELGAAQEALRQSQKMEAMGQLTGGVAHDFNNLLTPIIGSLDMLVRKGVGSERERRLIDGALQSAERAKTLVQRLLAFARRQPLQPTPVDVKRLVGGMADLIASTSGPKIDVRVELPDALPPAVADANQLEMALLNLAVNARDAMPDGGVLTIAAARESVRAGHRSKLRHGHYVSLSVKDTGVGMDEATLARAIEPFFSTKGIGKGTGLGLSMVHGLALQLNGGLTISSRLGEGTTIDLWLPISSVVADGDDEALVAAPAEKRQGKALLVDDEDLVRMSTADMLIDLGYEVVEAGSAEEALRLVGEGFNPDLLITDHLMPGMSGADLARDLRARRPELPVLIVSGYAEAEGIEPGLPRLTKPFRNAELAASLAALAPAVRV